MKTIQKAFHIKYCLEGFSAELNELSIIDEHPEDNIHAEFHKRTLNTQ